MIPDILYKYRMWNNLNHKKLLIDRELYWSAPSAFNDPFEFEIPLRYDLLTETERFEKYYNDLIQKGLNPSTTNENARNLSKNGLLSNKQHLEDTSQSLRNRLEKYGIVCLAKENDNILMWSHYGDSHKGYCIGFDVEQLKKHEPIIAPIQYLGNLPKLIPNTNSSIDNIFTILSSKYKGWNYEKEFRLLKYEWVNKVLKVEPDSFVEIILGAKMPERDRTEIISIANDKYPNLKIFKFQQHKYKFKLLLERIK